MLKSAHRGLDVVLTALRSEHEELRRELVGGAPEVLKRIGELGEAPSDDDWLFFPDWDLDLGDQLLTARLREESQQVTDEIADEDWRRFQAGVDHRIAHGTETTGVDPLRAEEAPLPVFSLLVDEHRAAVEAAPGEWSDFSQHAVERAMSPGAGAETWAVRTLRDEVEQRVERDTPIFEGPFRRVLEDRLRQLETYEKPQPKPWFRLLAPRRFGVGLAASMAMVVCLVVGSRLSERTSGYMPLSGEVSVDTVDFEGDLVMIPEEGVTMVVLTEV
ncbi:MAG: hypothetical protein KTR25_21070 [Myxococcales bacterium]|nr:hypothetical protein [Myxococcales bacterium]